MKTPNFTKTKKLQYIPADIARPLPPGGYIYMHNTYRQFAAERGIPALAALLWLLAKMLTDRRRPQDWVPKACWQRVGCGYGGEG